MTGDIIFSTRSDRQLQTINISQATCRSVRNTELFPQVKNIAKCEQRAIETLINNYLVEERAFYRLNERFVSNITRDIIFLTRSSKRLIRQTSHKRLADACQNTEIFLEVKHN